MEEHFFIFFFFFKKVRVGHFRPFPRSCLHGQYRGGRAPPLSMVAVLEGHDSVDEGLKKNSFCFAGSFFLTFLNRYESMLQNQVLSLFETMLSISVPSVSSSSRAEDLPSTGTDKQNRHARSKSISARHKLGVLKEIAQQQQIAESALGGKEDAKQNETTVKRLVVFVLCCWLFFSL